MNIEKGQIYYFDNIKSIRRKVERVTKNYVFLNGSVPFGYCEGLKRIGKSFFEMMIKDGDIKLLEESKNV